MRSGIAVYLAFSLLTGPACCFCKMWQMCGRQANKSPVEARPVSSSCQCCQIHDLQPKPLRPLGIPTCPCKERALQPMALSASEPVVQASECLSRSGIDATLPVVPDCILCAEANPLGSRTAIAYESMQRALSFLQIARC